MAKARSVPLWCDLGGRSTYRVFGALILDELCNGAEINTAELLRRLRSELRRPLSRQSLTAWRRGDQAIPTEVMMATGAIVRRTLADASVTVAMRVLSDHRADADFSTAVRLYYGHGRAEIP